MKMIIHLYLMVVLMFGIHLHAVPLMAKDTSKTTINPETSGGGFEGDIVAPITAGGTLYLGGGVVWPNGTIPYVISPGFSSASQQIILGAMRTLENSTAVNNISCVHFRERTDADGPFYITIVNGTGCLSYIGRNGNSNYSLNQTVVLEDPTCMQTGLIMHQLMHTLGFFHEQSRLDRDQYVTVIYGDIIPGDEVYFQKYSSSEVGSLNSSYDYGSIMHFGTNYFSINGSATLLPLNSSIAIGQRVALSSFDVEGVRALYNCYATSNVSTFSNTTNTSAPVVTNGTNLTSTSTVTAVSRTTNATVSTWTGTATTSTYTLSIPITLSINSPQFARPSEQSSNYYYAFTPLSIAQSGNYTFTSSSTFAVYTYLYKTVFDPSNPTSNVLAQGFNDPGQNMAQFVLSMSTGNTTSQHSARKRETTTYILVSTTVYPGVVGSFTITVSGPSTITVDSIANGTIIIINNAAPSDGGKTAGIIVGSIVGGIILLLCVCGCCLAIFCSHFYLKGIPFRSNRSYVDGGFHNPSNISSSIFVPSSFAGFYLKDGSWRGTDNLTLSFHPEAGYTLYGKGTDDRGAYVARGLYSSGTLRMAFDKVYQTGIESTSDKPSQTMTIQTEWNSNTDTFDGKYYLKVGRVREEHKYVMKMTNNKRRRH